MIDNVLRVYLVVENGTTVNPLALNERGFAHEKLKQYENAISDYTTAIEHKSADWGIYENRAFVYKTTGIYSRLDTPFD